MSKVEKKEFKVLGCLAYHPLETIGNYSIQGDALKANQKVINSEYVDHIEQMNRELVEALSKESLQQVVDDWQMHWMNQTINPKDTENYRRRASGIDANMKGGLVRMIREKVFKEMGD